MLALLGYGAQTIWDLRNAEQDRQTVVESESNTVIMQRPGQAQEIAQVIRLETELKLSNLVW